MRLQLTIGFAAVAVAVVAWGQDRVSGHVDVYRDPWITAVVPSLQGAVTRGNTSVEGGATVDAVSGATFVYGVDAVSSATPFDETRGSGNIRVTHALPGRVALGLGHAASVESDYVAHSPELRMRAEAFDRTATIGMRLGATFETVRSETKLSQAESSLAPFIDASWAQILDRRTSATVALTLGHAWCGPQLGCTANPYRFVPAFDDDVVTFAVHERHPTTRGRGAVALQLDRALTDRFAVHGYYRFYADTWSITGHTARLSTAAELLNERLMLGMHGRYATQTAAQFFEEGFDAGLGVPTYRTGDGELAKLWDVGIGGRAEWSFFDVGPWMRIGIGVRAEHVRFVYPELEVRSVRPAWLVGGGFDAEF